MRPQQRDISPLPIWGSEQVCLSASQWFAGLLEDIQAARNSICLQTYIFSVDTVGKPILDALCAASQRGVDVRVIVDGVGSSPAIDFLQQVLHAHHAQFHVYHPLPWHWITTRMEREDRLGRFLNRFAFINNRQHSKLCLIDGDIARTGSFNITEDHIERKGDGFDWKDCGVRITGERCLLLDEFFDAVWKQDVHALSGYFLFHPITNYSPALRRRRLRVLLQRIHGAKKNIWIASAYFSPIPRVVRALKKAGKRGVDVRIMVPAHSDIRFFPALSSTYYADLLRAGIRIHEYDKGMLHSKIMLVDEIMIVGSSNMNHRSALHDVEMDIELFSEQSRLIIANEYLENLLACREITLQNINKFYAWLLALGQIPRLLRYWL